MSFLNTLQEPPCSLDHLKERCVECGECWEWKGAIRKRRWPTIAFRRDWGDGFSANRQFYVRHLMYWHKHGKHPVLGRYRAITVKCGNPLCVNPDHILLQTRKQLAAKTAAAGHYKSLTRRIKLANIKRKTSKLSDEAVAEIRLADSRPADMARKHGISVTYAYMLRKGQWRKDYGASNPFAALIG